MTKEAVISNGRVFIDMTDPNTDGYKLRQLLLDFVAQMEAKFWARVAKHPGESSVTHNNYDWAHANIEDGEHHLIYEFLERFPQFIDRFPEVDKSRITIDDPMIEDVDMANLSFYDWACRKARQK